MSDADYVAFLFSADWADIGRFGRFYFLRILLAADMADFKKFWLFYLGVGRALNL
jgi:hypothetical protein